MTTDTFKYASLMDELAMSHELLRYGFGSLQEIDMANNLYHVPHQLMASGLERLMKCFISLVYEDRNGSFPSRKHMRQFGHDLEKLLQEICDTYYNVTNIPLLQREINFIRSDRVLLECIRILSLFGQMGRYYNLDIVTGSQDNPIDPKGEWKTLEMSIEDIGPYLSDTESLFRDYYPCVHSKLIAKIERLLRAIALQFTLGGHADTKNRLKQNSVIYTDFRNLQDEELGTIDYRRSVRSLTYSDRNWNQRSSEEILGGKWPARKITKLEFHGEWPFRVSEVIVECQRRLFCLVNIEGMDFALNGAAAGFFKVLTPHDAGVAILGRSVGPFTDMAFDLCHQNSDSSGM